MVKVYEAVTYNETKGRANQLRVPVDGEMDPPRRTVLYDKRWTLKIRVLSGGGSAGIELPQQFTEFSVSANGLLAPCILQADRLSTMNK